MAEWSKAPALGAGLARGVGSNPTVVTGFPGRLADGAPGARSGHAMGAERGARGGDQARRWRRGRAAATPYASHFWLLDSQGKTGTPFMGCQVNTFLDSCFFLSLGT